MNIMEDTNLTYDSCKNCDKLEAEICRLEMIWETERKIVNELKSWKESAISVMPDIQAIGKEMGLQIGQAISPKIIPYIKELKKEAAEQKEKQASLVIEIEQQKAISKAWEIVAEKKDKEREAFKKEANRLLNKSISQCRRILDLEARNKRLNELIKASNINGLPIDLNE